MSFNIHTLKTFLLPSILFATAAFVAMFALQSRDWLLPVLFMLLPFVDLQLSMPRIAFGRQSLISWAILSVVIILLLLQNAQLVDLFTMMVLVAALPEEWFFRAYLQKRLGNHIAAILIVSLLFSLMHFITQSSAIAWLVFVPSIFFGWVYKKTDDLILVVLLHALSNLLYYIYLQSYFVAFFDR